MTRVGSPHVYMHAMLRLLSKLGIQRKVEKMRKMLNYENAFAPAKYYAT